MKLKNKIALVTGGTSGIGFAIAKKLSEDGAKVVVVGRDQEKGKNATTQIKNSDFIVCDVTKESSIERVINQLQKLHGKLDIVVNCAGMNVTHGDISSISEQTYEQILNTDFKSIVFITKHSISHLQKTKGTIINISSQFGVTPDSEVPLYCAAKAAVIMFTKSTALTYGKDGVRINAVCPGAVKTPLLQQFFEDEQELTEWYSNPEVVPLERTGEPEEIANVVSFLASEEASYVTGAVWLVDGGSSVA